MATGRKRGNWKMEDLEKATEEVKEGKLSVREAAQKYSIPKSTVHDHSSSKVKEVSRPGPAPVLTTGEEKELVNWIITMAEVGYGQCRQQVCTIVKRILDNNARPNPFPNNLPGKDWWYAFLKRHPEISLRTPQALESYRAKACTPTAIATWYTDFEQFLTTHDLVDKPTKIWNCDESGFSLCPKSGKVLAPTGAKTVYYTCSSKGQITTLACVSASGLTIPPMHVFPGVRFSYNPMEGCVDGAFFGKSDNGWITQELFNGWLTKHFIRHIPADRPVCLLVDGHSSHIDLDTSRFCRDNNIHLYCLPPHSSHITQPLDVGFFSLLKAAWKRAVMDYNSEHPGSTVSKSSFSCVFRKAYLSTVKPEKIINAFRHSGIYPPNYLQIDQRKLLPSKVYEENGNKSKDSSTITIPTAKHLALRALEEELDEETLKRYETRLQEGYDLPDPLYSAWKKLKEKTNRVPLQDISNTAVPHQPTTISKDILQVPTCEKPTRPAQSRSIQSTACLPKVISSEEVIHFLEERRAKKETEEKLKQERQLEREERKKRKEEEKVKKAEEKSEKMRQREQQKAEQRRRKEEQDQKKAERKRKREEEKEEKEQKRKKKTNARFKQQERKETSADEECFCSTCDGKYNEESEIEETWIECEKCGRWYHLECAGVQEEEDFVCHLCQ